MRNEKKRNEERKLIVFENKIVKEVFGHENENEERRIRHNREMRDLYKDNDILRLESQKITRKTGIDIGFE